MLDKKSQRLNNLRGTCNEFDAKKSTDADGKRERDKRKQGHGATDATVNFGLFAGQINFSLEKMTHSGQVY